MSHNLVFLIAGGFVILGGMMSAIPAEAKHADYCASVYQPVCGVNGTTYSNACRADMAHVAVAREGACYTPPPTASCQPGARIACPLCRAGDSRATCRCFCVPNHPVPGPVVSPRPTPTFFPLPTFAPWPSFPPLPTFKPWPTITPTCRILWVWPSRVVCR